MDGTTLKNMSDEKLRDIIDDYRVFARTSPEDKIRLVKALQSKGEIVATFLAILELIRSNGLKIKQTKQFGDIIMYYEEV